MMQQQEQTSTRYATLKCSKYQPHYYYVSCTENQREQSFERAVDALNYLAENGFIMEDMECVERFLVRSSLVALFCSRKCCETNRAARLRTSVDSLGTLV